MGYWLFFLNSSLERTPGITLMTVAQKAILISEDCYRRNRSSFTTILRDVNLAIWIDFGPVHLVQVAGGLTVVGEPVVYACRLSADPAGAILLNQPAYEKISEAYGNLCLITETDIEIKHEGHIVVMALSPAIRCLNRPSPAGWHVSKIRPHKCNSWHFALVSRESLWRLDVYSAIAPDSCSPRPA